MKRIASVLLVITLITVFGSVGYAQNPPAKLLLLRIQLARAMVILFFGSVALKQHAPFRIAGFQAT